MKYYLLSITLIFSFLQAAILSADVSVRGYYRSDGTYVQPHYRSDPDYSPYNNWSFPGNTNPYTGETATGSTQKYLDNYYDRRRTTSKSYVTPKYTPEPRSTTVPNIRKNEASKDVVEVNIIEIKQMTLYLLGFYSGKIDGVFGPITREAIKSYQQSSALVTTGKLDQKTSKLLTSDLATRMKTFDRSAIDAYSRSFQHSFKKMNTCKVYINGALKLDAQCIKAYQ